MPEVIIFYPYFVPNIMSKIVDIIASENKYPTQH